jgi:hypothetical protein
MYSLLIKEVTGYIFSQVNRSSVDMLEIYKLVAGKKVNMAGHILRKTVQTDGSHRLLLKQVIFKSSNEVTPAAHPITLSSTTAKI